MIMTEIEKAEEILANLQAKQRGLASKAVELADERQRISFAAHANGDTKARKRLDEITAATVARQSEMASIEAAISEGEKRLAAAKAAADREADRQQAKQLEQEVQCFAALCVKLDASFRDIVKYSGALKETLDSMHRLGSAAPSSAQLDSLGGRACLSALRLTMWSRSFESVPPLSRCSFVSLADQWLPNIRRDIERRMGDEQKTTEAA